MVAAFPPPDGPRVLVHDDIVYIDGLAESDPDVVATVITAEDPVTAVRKALAVGARVLRVSGASLDAEVIRAEVDKLSEHFTGTVTSAVERITATSSKLLDGENGELPTALTAFRGEVEQLLEGAFDPDSRKSVLARIETAFVKAAEEQLRAIRRLVNPASEDSPLHHWQAEIIQQVQHNAKAVTDELRALSEKVIVQQASAKAAAEALERSSSKGFTFEDLLHSLLEPCASMHGDLAEQTGRERGVTGTMRGDEVVTLCPDDTHGTPTRFVFEIKDRRLGQKKTFEELDAAMANRDAVVGIAVFSNQAKAPSTAPFVFYDTKAILVIDKEDPEPGALRLAYMWARWTTLRQMALDDSELNLERVEALLDDARRELGRISSIKRAHSTAAKKIDEAGREASAMANGLRAILDTLSDEITASGPDVAGAA